MLSHFVPSLLVCNVYPLTVVLTVAVTLPFVHSLGLYANVVFDVVNPVTLPVVVLLLVLTFPALSFTHT